MTNETTASQPKSIGDDALGEFIDEYEWRTDEFCHKPTETERLMLLDFAVNLDDSRAPAAKAFATIQAAPDDMPSTIEDARKLIQYLRIEIDSKVMELYDIKKKLAATIQEPAMVAEPVSVVSVQELSDLVDRALALPKSLSTRSWELTPIQLGWIIGQVCRSQVAAPMVADPAGVAVHAKVECYFFDTEDVRLVLTDRNDKREIRMHNDDAWFIVNAIAAAKAAATVKAVPSEAMPATQEPKYGIRCNRLFNRASGEFIPADEPVFIFRARDFHAADAIGWYSGGVTNFEHYRAVSDRVMQFRAFADKFPSRMKEPDTANFAAPLADKTGGGE